MPGRLYEATWGRLFAGAYDRCSAGAEDAGLRERRADLLAGARGEVLEIGAGTGANLRHYPGAVQRLVLTEPSPHMAAQLAPKVAATRPTAEVVAAGAEALPFADESFDTVVSTLVLCTVDDPEQSVAEIRRVLRPGGRLLFLEHVRAEDPGLARWQDRLETPWRLCAAGCHCNRDTVGTIARLGLTLEDDVVRTRTPKAPPIVRPLVAGAARAA